MKNDLQKFALCAISIIVLFVVMDLFVGIVLDWAMTKLPDYSGQLAKDNYRINRVDKDIVIIGSSRGSHHYVTTILDDSIADYLGYRVPIYNGAIDGKFANSNCCAVESILNRYCPKLIILEMSEGELANGGGVSDLEFSAPYYWHNSVVRDYLDRCGWKERIKMKSSFYRYNDRALRIAKSFMTTGNDSTGYEPIFGTLKDTLVIDNEKKERSYADINQFTLENFIRVLKKCKEKNVAIIVTTSPRYRPNDNNDILDSICRCYGVPHIERYNNELFNTNLRYFKDRGHLNDIGAHVYTSLFFGDLKSYLDIYFERNNRY